MHTHRLPYSFCCFHSWNFVLLWRRWPCRCRAFVDIYCFWYRLCGRYCFAVPLFRSNHSYTHSVFQFSISLVSTATFNSSMYACTVSACTNTIPFNTKNSHAKCIQAANVTDTLHRVLWVFIAFAPRLQVWLLYSPIHIRYTLPIFKSQTLFCLCMCVIRLFMQIYAVYSRFHLHQNHQAIFRCLYISLSVCERMCERARRWISKRTWMCGRRLLLLLLLLFWRVNESAKRQRAIHVRKRARNQKRNSNNNNNNKVKSSWCFKITLAWQPNTWMSKTNTLSFFRIRFECVQNRIYFHFQF